MRSVVSTIFVLLVLMPFVSAEIIFSQPNDLYNMGDLFEMDITISPEGDTSGFLVANLECGDKKTEFYRSPVNVERGESRQISLNSRLEPFLVGGLTGSCRIVASIENIQRESQRFRISERIEVAFNTEKNIYLPGENIIIDGSAIKENGDLANGFAEILSESLGILRTEILRNGEFEYSIRLSENAPAGNHDIRLRVYEKNQRDETLNSGNSSRTITINQVPKSISVALDSDSVSPGDGLDYRVVVRDQTDEKMDVEARVSFYNPIGAIFYERYIESDISERFETEINYEGGRWKIKSEIGNLTNERRFNIVEKAVLNYELIENFLYIENVGNVEFSGSVDLLIGGNEGSVNVHLNAGERKRYRLSAPDGEYEIFVRDEQERNIGSTLLTGRAVEVREANSGRFSGNRLSLILWILVIGVLIYILVKVYKNTGKIPFVGKTPNVLKRKNKKQPIPVYTPSESGPDSGKKEVSEIIILKLKNYHQIEKRNDAISAITDALEIAREMKGKTYTSENSRIIIFSPSITGEKDNASRAVETARKIKERLDIHAKNYPNGKINYGLGINSGEMITEKTRDKFKFTSLGNLISSTKNLADSSSGEIMISEKIRGKTVGKVKTEKISPKAWKVANQKTKYKYDDFIDKFKPRTKRD